MMSADVLKAANKRLRDEQSTQSEDEGEQSEEDEEEGEQQQSEQEEEGGCVANEAKKEVIELGGEGGLYVTDYSAKAVAVFGETRPLKEMLKALGGRFNFRLTEPKTSTTASGWVFGVGVKVRLLEHLREYVETGNVPALPPAGDAAAAAAAGGVGPSVIATFPKLGVSLVDYSAKAIAVFGATKPIKALLSSLKGRFNGALADPSNGGASTAGWVFAKTLQPQLVAALAAAVPGAGAGAGGGAATTAAAASKAPKSSAPTGKKAKKVKTEAIDE